MIVVLTVVIASTTGGGNGGEENVTKAAPASVANGVRHVPPSVFNSVGVTSPKIKVSQPTIIKGQPLLTFTINGQRLPGVFYYGAEYCPYCAAERWPTAVALSRFGTFSHLEVTKSSSTDPAGPNTPTLSFAKATFSSPYVAVKTVEAENRAGRVLEVPTRAEGALVRTYDTAKYVQSLQSSSDGDTIPFITFGNRALIVGASYSPGILAGLTQTEIARGLTDPSNPVSRAIISAANYQSALICDATGGKPASVCSSSGVQAAAKALRIRV